MIFIRGSILSTPTNYSLFVISSQFSFFILSAIFISIFKITICDFKSFVTYSSGFSQGGLNYRASRMQSSLLELLRRSRKWCRWICFTLLFTRVRDNILKTRVRDKDCVKNRVKRVKIVRFTLFFYAFLIPNSRL